MNKLLPHKLLVKSMSSTLSADAPVFSLPLNFTSDRNNNRIFRLPQPLRR